MLKFWALVRYNGVVMNKQIAQATQVPSNGASNAEDFQPPTNNPQQAPTNLQQGRQGLQEANGYQSLTDNPDARIIVPVNPAESKPEAPEQPEGINWLPIVLFFVVFAVAIGALYAVMFRFMNSAPDQPDEAQNEEDQQPADDLPKAKQADDTPAVIKEKRAKIQQKKSKSSGKSKSRRKHKRK